MGHHIPTLFIRGRWDPAEPLPEDWNEAISLLPEETFEPPGPFQVTSRNGWCEALVVKVTRGLGMAGFDFLEAEVSYLDGEALTLARKTADDLFEVMASERLPALPAWAGDSAVEALRALGPDLVRTAKVDRDLDADRGATGFYAFLKTFVAEADAALAGGDGLLVIRPQP